MQARTLRLVALASTCLWPLAALADDSDFDFDPGEAPAAPAEMRQPVLVNEMTVGVGAQNHGAARFGRFTGSTEAGAIGSGSLRMQSRATGPEEGTGFAIMEADNFNIYGNTLLPNSSAGFRLGQQGTWDAALSYDGVPYVQSDNFHTVLGTSGELLNGLTGRSLNATASNAAGAARANQYMSIMDVGTRRDQVAGKLRYTGLEDWTFATKMQHEHKQGSKINSLMFIHGNFFASFPEPVDYDTDRFTASAAYTTRPFQALLSYTYSSFTNSQEEYQAQSPFIAAYRAGYQATQYSLPPSNSEHQIKGQFGLNLTDSTRIAANLRYGLQVQDETFKARFYEATPISDTAYDGMIQNRYANVALTARPVKDWNVRVAYTVDQRDNSSTTYRSASYRSDSGTATWNGNGTLRDNTPYSFLNQSADLELGYKVLKSTKLTLDYSYQDRQRTYSVTSRNQESIGGGRVQTTFMPGLTGTLGYSRAIRQATAYQGSRGWNEMNRPVTAENELGMYTYAARERDEWKGNLNWGAGPDLSLGANARFVRDHFPNSYYGVTDNNMASLGPDLTYTPVKGVTTHFYYTYQENFTDLMAFNNSANNNLANGTVWNLKNTDTVHTMGARGDWQVTDRLKLSAENNLSYGNTAFEEASWVIGTATLSATNRAVTLPNAKSVTNSLKLSGEYELYDNVFFGLSGLWERFLNKDYLNAQLAASSANQTNTAILPGEGNPGYSVGVLMASARMVW